MNAAPMHIHKARTKPAVPWDQAENEFDRVSFSEYPRDPQPTPEEQLHELEHWEMLEDTRHKLPVENRRAIQLCKFADYSLKEAASTLGLPVGTLKARLHRGRRALMVSLKKKTQVRRKPASNKRSLQLCPASEESLCAA